MAGSVRADERWLLSANGALTLPVSSPQRELFRVGGAAAFEVDRTLAPFVTAGAGQSWSSTRRA